MLVGNGELVNDAILGGGEEKRDMTEEGVGAASDRLGVDWDVAAAVYDEGINGLQADIDDV